MIAELASYRERRTVRRIGAVALVTIALVAAVARAQEAWGQLEWAIRKAADLLPEEGETHAVDA